MQPNQLDPQIVNLTKAIRQQESGGKFDAVSPDGSYGAYQFIKSTWDATAPKYGVNAGWKEATPQQQNEVAYKQIAEWKGQGYNVGQIASMWNAGRGEPDAYLGKFKDGRPAEGTNSAGVNYSVPNYAKAVATHYQYYKSQDPQSQQPVQSQAPGPDQYTGFLGTKPNDSLYGNIIDNSITRGIQAFFPGQKVGQTIGTLAGVGYEKVKGVVGGQDNSAYYDLNAPTLTQNLGDIAQGALTVAMPGAGEGAGLGARIGTQAVLGAGFGASGSLAEGNTNPGTIASDTLKGAAIGGTLGVAGEALGAGLNKITKPFVKDLQPEVMQSANKIGIQSSELPISAITNSKTVRYAESLYNGEKIANQVDSVQNRLQKITNDIIAKTGAEGDLVTAGQNIAKGLSDFESSYKKATNQLYETFAEKGGSLSAKPFNSIDTINNIIDAKIAIGEGKDLQYFKDKLAVLTGGETKEADFKLPTFDVLKKVRTAVGEKVNTAFNDPFVKQNIGQFKQLYAALSKDMEETITSTGNKKLIDSLARANTAYKQGLSLMNTEYANSIRKYAENGQFDKIIPALTSPTKSIANIPAMLRVIGEKNVPNLQSAILTDIFTKAQGTSEAFTERGIAKMINKYGEDRLQKLLTPEQFGFLKDLDVVVKALGQAEKISKGSQTAFLGKTFANITFSARALKDLFTGNLMGFVTNLSPLLGEKVAQTFLNSDMGRKIVTTGFSLNKNVIPAIRQTTKVVNMQVNK
jgi:hypothetical protein